MEKLQRSFKILAVFLIFVFLISGCTISTGKQNSVQGKMKTKTIKIGVLRIEDNLPFFVAEEENIFAENKVKVELVSFNSARERDIALEAEEIDAGLADLVAVALIKKGGTDVQVVSLGLGAAPAEGRFVILSAPNSGIEKPEDLKGIPIAISNNTIINYLAEKMPQEVGLNIEDIKTQNIPDIKLRLESLLEGKEVQAALLPDPLATLAEKSGARVVIDDTKLKVNLSQTVILFRTETINNQKEDVAAVLKAYEEGAQNLNKSPEKYHDLIVEKARIPKPLENSYPAPTYSPLELPTQDMISRVMDWMVVKEILEKPYSYDEIVDTSFIEVNK